MPRTDIEIHTKCIASIKKRTMQPYEYVYTRFYESNTVFPYPEIDLNLQADELLICSTVMDAEHYSIVTTQRLITRENGQEYTGNIEGAADKQYGDFKGYTDGLFTLGKITLQDGSDMTYFIETGRASMITIHGVRSLIRLRQ